MNQSLNSFFLMTYLSKMLPLWPKLLAKDASFCVSLLFEISLASVNISFGPWLIYTSRCSNSRNSLHIYFSFTCVRLAFLRNFLCKFKVRKDVSRYVYRHEYYVTGSMWIINDAALESFGFVYLVTCSVLEKSKFDFDPF